MSAPAAGSPDEPGGRPFARGLSGSDEIPIDVDLIKVLASDTRRQVLRLLGERRRTLSELAEACGLKKATILEHLEKLVAADLIRRIDDGERIWIYYELTPRGMRIVRPGRSTRFYLIMAGSAAALLIVGALVAAAMLGGVGPNVSSDNAAGGREMLADDVRAPQAIVVWRGFDDNVPIVLESSAPDATLLVGPLELPVNGSRALLSAEHIDTLPPGQHPLRLRTAAGELRLPTTIESRAPPVALAPLAIPEDEATTLVLTVGAPGMPRPTNVTVLVDGNATALGETGSDRALTLAPAEPGTLDVQVGRLVRLDVRVLPSIHASAANDNGTLALDVRDAVAPLENATLSLGGVTLGTTDAEGKLRAAWPAEGEHALRIAAADGRVAEHAVLVSNATLDPIPPRLQLMAFADPGASSFVGRVDVSNLGPAPETVTLVARLDGSPIASTLVEVAANGAAQATLRADVPLVSPVVIDAYAAREGGGAEFAWKAYALESGTAFNGTADSSPPPAAPAPTAPTPTAPTTVAARSLQHDSAASRFSLSRAPDASTTLYPTVPSAVAADAGTAPPAPAVPFPAPALLVAVAVAVALLMGRRGAGRR